MKNAINDVKCTSMQNIPKLSDFKVKIDQANQVAVQAEQVMDFAAEEAGEKPEESELLDHYERSLRLMIRKVLSS